MLKETKPVLDWELLHSTEQSENTLEMQELFLKLPIEWQKSIIKWIIEWLSQRIMSAMLQLCDIWLVHMNDKDNTLLTEKWYERLKIYTLNDKIFCFYIWKFKWRNVICADTASKGENMSWWNWNTIYFDKDWYVLHCEETFIDDMPF